MQIQIATTKNDLRGIIEVQKLTWLDRYTNDNLGITKEDILKHYKKKSTPAYLEKRWKKFNNPLNPNWIALSDGKVIGWIGCSVDKHKIGSFGLYVLPEFQSQGIGGKLLRVALEWLLQNSQTIEIGVLQYNHKAIKFYEKYGFTILDKKEDFSIGGKRIEDIVIKMQYLPKHVL